jgi:uncharacterized protein
MPNPFHLALLAISALIAATLAAVTGFGGAAILLPVLVLTFGVREAIPILTVAQLVGNGSRVWFNRRHLQWAVVGWFALGSIPCALIGGLLFARAPVAGLTRGLGVFLVLVVVYRHLTWIPHWRPPAPAFAAIGAGASFVSALVGSVGPLMAPFFLDYGLTKAAYIATEALTTVIMHSAKLVAYREASVLPVHAIAIGLAVGPLMVAGSFLGKLIVDHLPERVFIYLVEATLVIAGTMFVVKG